MYRILGWILGGVVVLAIQAVVVTCAGIKRYPTNPFIWGGVLLTLVGFWAGAALPNPGWTLAGVGAFMLTPFVVMLVDWVEGGRPELPGRGIGGPGQTRFGRSGDVQNATYVSYPEAGDVDLANEEDDDEDDDDWLRPPLAA